MRLPYCIAVTLGFITCLSSFMLGLGQNDYMLPVLMFLAAGVSLYLTDFRRIIQLGDWSVNVLVLLAVFLTIGDIVRTQGEDLAFSIARTLVFVEMILLFREKATRFCWQILLISLLQVAVATVMQQSLMFGFLLILYVFAGLCAFLLIFLQSENQYFRKHSFLETFIGSLKAEIAERQDRGRLVRIALGTLVAGPLSLVLSFSSPQQSGRGTNKIRPKDDHAWEIIRSLFTVFPTDQDGKKGHWEIIGNGIQPTLQNEQTSWHETLWDEAPTFAGKTSSNSGDEKNIVEKELVPVPQSENNHATREQQLSRRFPLLEERPAFSAGTMHSNGLEGGRKELFWHLVRGTLFSLCVAVVLFSLIPRIGKIEFWNYTFYFGHENWTKTFAPVGSIGFKEEIRLGSLGTILPYHREVMTVRFTDIPDRRVPHDYELSMKEVPYNAIQGTSIYFRGIALDTYSRGVWSPPQTKDIEFDPENPSVSPELLTSYFDALAIQPRLPFRHPLYGVRPGARAHPEMGPELFFDSASDLIALHMVIQPLDSTVFFAPWPFFSYGRVPLRPSALSNGSIHEMRVRERVLKTTVMTTAFSRGVQNPLTPCQDSFEYENLLRVPDQGLENLAALAAAWDMESGCPANDMIGRATFMEQKFLFSDQFSYKLGKTTRSYGLDPLEDFIGNNSSGHCEYFAGALALMLRSVGIPARVVIGFKTEVDFGDGAAPECMIRQSDAHAWVEVYVSNDLLAARVDASSDWWRQGGWFRLDPTPAGEAQTALQRFSFNLRELKEWIELAWGDFVLNMNSQKQADFIYQPLHNGATLLLTQMFASELWTNTIPGILNYYKNLLFRGNIALWNTWDWSLILAPILLFTLLFYLVWRIVRPLWQSLRKANAEARRRKATVDFYVRMERILAAVGRERRSGETPREYVRAFDFQSETSPIVETFYRVKFGGFVLTGEELRDVRSRLDRLERFVPANKCEPGM